jgi:uncharacterized protein YoxC
MMVTCTWILESRLCLVRSPSPRGWRQQRQGVLEKAGRVAASLSSAMAPKRPHFNPQEIDEQLQQVYLSTDFIGSQNESLEHLALIIRNIHASRQQDAYLRQLGAYIKDKEGEIEEVCKTNYQVRLSLLGCVYAGVHCSGIDPFSSKDFVTSTDKLLKVRKGTASLRHRVVELNEDIQSKGGQVAARVRDLSPGIYTMLKFGWRIQKKELHEWRRVSNNIDEAIDTLQACLRVLDLSSKVAQLISDKKYYSALRVCSRYLRKSSAKPDSV